jgi:hypothetical protein
MSAPAIPSSIQMRRFHPGAGAPSADRSTSSSPPWADVSLAGDGDGKIEDSGAAQSRPQTTSVQGAHGHLPPAPTPSARRVDETAAVSISLGQASCSTSATLTARSSEYSLTIASQSGNRAVPMPGMDPSLPPRSVSSEAEPAPTASAPFSRYELPAAVASVVRSASLTRLSPASDREADGLEQPHEMAQASAEDQIAALRRQLEEQQGVNASFEERLGRLETAGKADATADVVVSFPPDAREATVHLPPADADANPDATVGGVGTAERVRTCKLAESMWDGALFLGRPEVGMGIFVTLWAVLVLLLNILLQTTIAVIVVRKMGDPRFVTRIIEDLWYASEPRLAAAKHVSCRIMAFAVYVPKSGGRCGRWCDRRSSLGFG